MKSLPAKQLTASTEMARWKPVARWAWTALLALCCGAPAIAQGRTDLASGTYSCLGGVHKANINELNMSSATGNFNFIEVKVLDASLPSNTKLCYTAKSGGDFDSICTTVGDMTVWRGGSDLGSDTAFAVGDYLILNVPSGTNGVNEAILLDSSNKAIDNIQLCAGSCPTGYWPIADSSCGAQIANVGARVKDVARFPEDGTGGWTSDTLSPGVPANGTVGESNAPASAAPHHFELRHASGSGLTCATSALTVKACADSACGTVSTSGASGSVTGGAGTIGFTIASGSSTTDIDFQPLAGAATLGASGALNATTCNFGGSNPCTFTGTSAGFIFSKTATGGGTAIDINDKIDTHTAGVASTPSYYLRAVKASTTNAAVCTPAITDTSRSVTMSYTCNDPNSCQNAASLAINGTPAIFSAGGDVTFNFDATGSAPITFRYEDVGRITVNASMAFTPTGGTAVTLSGATNPFVVKPHHFELSDIKCGTVNNPSPAAATDPNSKFCKAGANFSVTATARTANATPTTARNFGRESSPESIKLSASLPAGLGLASNPGLSGTLGAVNTDPAIGLINTGAASGTFSWNEVGILTLTPSLDDPLTPAVETYLGAVGGEVSGTAVNVGRFVPDHYDTEVVTPPVFAYSGQPFTVRVTAKLATPTAAVPLTTTSANYMAPGFPREVTLSALALDGTALAAALGALSNEIMPVAAFATSIGTATRTYTFTATPTAPTVIRLRAEDTDNVTSALIEGNTEIRSGRLRLSNAFGRANANLTIPMRAEYWSGQSWLINNLDNESLIPADAVALTLTLTGVGGVTVDPIAKLVGGQGTIVLKKTGSSVGSVDLAVNLGSTSPDQSCLEALPRPVTTGAAQPWLRSLNGKCATGYNSDPSARGTFGIYSPESRKVIHIRESFN